MYGEGVIFRDGSGTGGRHGRRESHSLTSTRGREVGRSDEGRTARGSWTPSLRRTAGHDPSPVGEGRPRRTRERSQEGKQTKDRAVGPGPRCPTEWEGWCGRDQSPGGDHPRDWDAPRQQTDPEVRGERGRVIVREGVETTKERPGPGTEERGSKKNAGKGGGERRREMSRRAGKSRGERSQERTEEQEEKRRIFIERRHDTDGDSR